MSLWASLYPLSVRMTILVPAGMALSTRASVAAVVSPFTPALMRWT